MIRRLILTLAALFIPSAAHAQHVTETFISFETDCAGNLTPNTENILGYKEVPTSLYAPCGLLSATSGGTFGTQQLFNPPLDPVIGRIIGMHGSWAFAGAFTLAGGTITFGTVELVFSPPVNQVSFDVLEMANPIGLSIDLLADNGTSIATFTPTVMADEMIHFEHTSTTPIAKITLDYIPAALDGWFIDSLRFNAFSCGDGEVEAGEDCDDQNDVACDGCGNDCRTTLNGCLDGTTCVASGSVMAGSNGCAVCDLTQRAPGNDVGYSPQGEGTACDDGQFCTVDDVCDGRGACTGAARDCSDANACTIESCNEATDACTSDVGSGCFVDGACHATGDRNPENPCEACNPSANPEAWTTLTGGETCGNASCSDGTLTPAPTCDASGACVESEPVDCEGSVCADPFSCVNGCEDDTDCQADHHCEAGTCVPDDTQGEPCERDSQCSTGHCEDRVCCDRACGGTCEACNAEGRRGECAPVEVGTDPDDECEGAGVCSAEQTCVSYEVRGNGLCALPPASEQGPLGIFAALCAVTALLGARRSSRRD